MSTQTHANAGASSQFKPADLVVPTTRMLAIGRLTEAGKSAARFPIMPSEVRETIRLHLTGKIDQWFFQTEGGGVVFIMNVTERAEACELLEALPLGQAGMMAFELIPAWPAQASCCASWRDLVTPYGEWPLGDRLANGVSTYVRCLRCLFKSGSSGIGR